MAVIIKSTPEERNAVLTAISLLNDNAVVRHMSYASIAATAGMNPEKVRVVLDDLLTDKVIARVDVSRSSRVPRYYYVRIT